MKTSISSPKTTTVAITYPCLFQYTDGSVVLASDASSGTILHVGSGNHWKIGEYVSHCSGKWVSYPNWKHVTGSMSIRFKA